MFWDNSHIVPLTKTMTDDSLWNSWNINELFHNTLGSSSILQINLLDHSMYDTYQKDDIINICSASDWTSGQDVLGLLPNKVVIFRRIVSCDDGMLHLIALNSDFESYVIPQSDFTLLGIAKGIIRLS